MGGPVEVVLGQASRANVVSHPDRCHSLVRVTLARDRATQLLYLRACWLALGETKSPAGLGRDSSSDTSFELLERTHPESVIGPRIGMWIAKSGAPSWTSPIPDCRAEISFKISDSIAPGVTGFRSECRLIEGDAEGMRT